VAVVLRVVEAGAELVPAKEKTKRPRQGFGAPPRRGHQTIDLEARDAEPSMQPTCSHASGRRCLLLPDRPNRVFWNLALPRVAAQCRGGFRVQIPAARPRKRFGAFSQTDITAAVVAVPECFAARSRLAP
jgi:hypothetical protein